MYDHQQKNIVAAVLIILAALILQLVAFRVPPYLLIIIFTMGVMFLIAFLKTNLAIGILIFSMLLSPEISVGGGIPGRSVVVRFDDFLIFMLFFGWLARMAVNKELGFIRVTPINKPVLTYIVICLIASFLGIVSGTTDAKNSFFYNLKYIEYFLLFFMISNNIFTKNQIKAFIFLIFLVALIVGIFASYVAIFEGTRASAPFEGEAGEPNTLAGYLILMIALAFGISLNVNTLWLKALTGGLTAFLLYPLLQTLSRAGWLGSLAMFVAFLVFSRRNKAFLLSIVMVVVIAAPFIVQKMPENVKTRYESSFRGGDRFQVGSSEITLDESASIRIRTWKNSLKLWSERPILGRGVPGGGVVSDVQYTRILREVGILGFLAFVWMIRACFQVGWEAYRQEGMDGLAQGISLGYLCSLVGILVMGVAAEVFIIIRIMEPFWFLSAVVVNLPEIYGEWGERRGTEQPIPAAPLSLT